MTFSDPYLIERCQEIELTLVDASKWASIDAKLGAHLAAYIAVLIIGVLEDCIEYLFSQRVHKTGDSEVENYIVKVIGDRFKNPNYGKISGLLGEFSDEYQKKFKARIASNGSEIISLDSLLSNKNSLAHMGTVKLQMTITEVNEYYQRLIPILEAVDYALK